MISLTRERGLLWLRYEPLQSVALRLGINSFLLCEPLYYLVSQVSLSFSQDCSLLSGSLALEALLIGVPFKKRYINVYICNTIQSLLLWLKDVFRKRAKHLTIRSSPRFMSLPLLSMPSSALR